MTAPDPAIAVPANIRALPKNKVGYPIPWFVATLRRSSPPWSRVYRC